GTPILAIRRTTSSDRRGAFDNRTSRFPAPISRAMQSSTPGKGAVPSCTTPHKSRMKPSYSGISARMPSIRRIDMSDLPFLFREDCWEVPPLVQDPHNIDVFVSDPIEDRIGAGDG